MSYTPKGTTLAELLEESRHLKQELFECAAIRNSCDRRSRGAIFRATDEQVASLREAQVQVNAKIARMEQSLWSMKPRAHCPCCYHPVILTTPAHLQEVHLFGVYLPVERRITDLQCAHCKGPRMRKY